MSATESRFAVHQRVEVCNHGDESLPVRIDNWGDDGGGSYIDENGNVLPVKRSFANVATNTTDGELVAAVTGARIRVLAMAMVAGATAQSVTFCSKPSGSHAAISALFANAANGGAVLPYNKDGWFQTLDGEALTALTAAAGSTTGFTFTYVEVPGAGVLGLNAGGALELEGGGLLRLN